MRLIMKNQKSNIKVMIKKLNASIHNVMASILGSSSDEETEEDDQSPEQKFIKLMNEYQKEKRLDAKLNPHTWWNMNTKFQCLASIAKKYLSAPATAVASEQFFSNAGFIYNPLRTRLQGEKAIKLLFIKYNLPLLNFQYE
ncbi:Zinc finger BED domain-containing protein 4 [Formica fusca]